MADEPPTCPPLLASLVDDAGLFPPAQLAMDDALARHAADAEGLHPMLTHRFVVNAARLGLLQAGLPAGGSGPLALSLILDGDPAGWPGALEAVSTDGRLRLAMVEVTLPAEGDPAEDAAAALEVLDRYCPGIPAYFEPPRPQWFPLGTGGAGVRGLKVRCGGARAEQFPSPAQLAAVIVDCAAGGTPFKASAGLHHAVRHTDPDTGFVHHGFLNLLIAAARARGGADHADVETALSITDAGPLVAEAREMPEATAAGARALLVSYGSCSTSEPVEEAAALGLLAEGE